MSRNRALRSAALALALGASAPAFAQQTLPSREELNPGRTAPVPAAPRGDLFRQMEAGPCGFADSDLKVTLRSVEFRGANGPLALGADALAPAYADLLGQELPIRAVCEIRDRAATLYLRRGVLAAVTIPEQRIAEGRLVLEVVEAHVAEVRVTGEIGPARRQVARYLNKLRGLAPFDLDIAQRYLLLASDVPGVVVRPLLRPAPEGRGAVVLEVVVARDPAAAALNLRNFGSREIGRQSGTARIDLNSFTALGERTSLTAYTTFDREQNVVQLAERFNIGGEGLALELSGAAARTRPGGALAGLDLESRSFAGSARLSFPLVRHRRRNLSLSGGIEWIDQKVEFGGGLATLTDDRLRVLFARLDGHWAPRALADHSVAITGSLELRKGLKGLGASPYGSPDASRFLGRPDAAVLRADLQAAGVIAGPLIGSVALALQHSDDPLLSYEEYSAGNLSFGRGYDPSIASGDRMRGASFEITTVPLPLWNRAAVRPFAFYETVRLTNVGPGADSVGLSSAGGGARFQLHPRIALDLTWARPLDRIAPATPRPPERLLASLTATL